MRRSEVTASGQRVPIDSGHWPRQNFKKCSCILKCLKFYQEVKIDLLSHFLIRRLEKLRLSNFHTPYRRRVSNKNELIITLIFAIKID